MNTMTETIVQVKLTREPKVLAKVVFANAEVLESDLADAKPGTTINVVAFDNEAREALSKLSNEDTFNAYAHTATNPKDGSLRLVVEGFAVEAATNEDIDYVADWHLAKDIDSLFNAGWVEAQEWKWDSPVVTLGKHWILAHPSMPNESDWISPSLHGNGEFFVTPWMF